jgi:hypothetical protein
MVDTSGRRMGKHSSKCPATRREHDASLIWGPKPHVPVDDRGRFRIAIRSQCAYRRKNIHALWQGGNASTKRNRSRSAGNPEAKQIRDLQSNGDPDGGSLRPPLLAIDDPYRQPDTERREGDTEDPRGIVHARILPRREDGGKADRSTVRILAAPHKCPQNDIVGHARPSPFPPPRHGGYNRGT